MPLSDYGTTGGMQKHPKDSSDPGTSQRLLPSSALNYEKANLYISAALMADNGLESKFQCGWKCATTTNPSTDRPPIVHYMACRPRATRCIEVGYAVVEAFHALLGG
jgi:hypothetical protein